MAVLCISKLPPEVTLDQVQAVTREVAADGPPAGGISHVAIVDGGQVKIFDVWESEEAMNTFTSERLVPAIQKQMAAMGAEGVHLDSSRLTSATSFLIAAASSASDGKACSGRRWAANSISPSSP